MKAGSLIALLVAAVLLLPVRSAPATGLVTDSPQTVCGESAALTEAAPQGAEISDGGGADDTVEIIVAVVVIILIICFLSYIADMGSQ